jgi:hypothetical protein
MNLISKQYDKTEVQITSFETKKGITEYHLLFQQTDCLEDYPTQLQNLLQAYTQCVEELPGNPTAVFRRYFLSDVTNQTASLMEQDRSNPYCALSIVQQAPMNGTKIALWAWLQTGVQTQVLPSNLFEARHGNYRQLFGANLCNRAANSEYQTRLIFRDYIMQLTAANCTLANNCIRTWIFVQNVDVNYPGVVKARKDVFATQNLTENTHFIASTGIEGRYQDTNVFVTMDTYAVSGIGQEQIQYTADYIQKTFVDKGMCADWSIHDKGDGNPHVHLLLTMRPFNPDHSWGKKEVKDWDFVRDKNGNIVIDESHPNWWQDKKNPDRHGIRIPVLDENGIQKIGARNRLQ